MEDAARPVKVVQVYGINSAGQPVLLKLNNDGTLVQGTGGALVEGMAQRVDEFVQVVGLNSSGHPILLKLNDDGTVSGGGSSLTAAQLAAIQGANAPTGLNPFATIADVGGGAGVEVIDLPFAWDDVPAKNTGVLLYQPAYRDSILGLAVHVETAFNGTSPFMYVYWDDGTDFYTDGSNDIFYALDLTIPDIDVQINQESPGHKYTIEQPTTNILNTVSNLGGHATGVNGQPNLAVLTNIIGANLVKATPPAIKIAIGKAGMTFDPLDSTAGKGLARLIIAHVS